MCAALTILGTCSLNGTSLRVSAVSSKHDLIHCSSHVGSSALVQQLVVAADPRGLHSRLAVRVLLVPRVLRLLPEEQKTSTAPRGAGGHVDCSLTQAEQAAGLLSTRSYSHEKQCVGQYAITEQRIIINDIKERFRVYCNLQYSVAN